MSARRSVLLSLGASVAATAGAVVYSRRRDLARARASFRTSSSPSARWYESVFDRVLGGLYDRIASEVAGTLGRSLPLGGPPRVLEIGPGPGGLALRLAGALPALDYTGVDIDPAMVARAAARAEAAGTTDRLAFVAGDVAALPFEDASFDFVVSTLSVHHWANPAAGFAELRRVLRPDGVLLVVDLSDAWGRLEAHVRPLAASAADAFPDGQTSRFAWPGRLSFLQRFEVP